MALLFLEIRYDQFRYKRFLDALNTPQTLGIVIQWSPETTRFYSVSRNTPQTVSAELSLRRDVIQIGGTFSCMIESASFRNAAARVRGGEILSFYPWAPLGLGAPVVLELNAGHGRLSQFISVDTENLPQLVHPTGFHSRFISCSWQLVLSLEDLSYGWARLVSNSNNHTVRVSILNQGTPIHNQITPHEGLAVAQDGQTWIPGGYLHLIRYAATHLHQVSVLAGQNGVQIIFHSRNFIQEWSPVISLTFTWNNNNVE